MNKQFFQTWQSSSKATEEQRLNVTGFTKRESPKRTGGRGLAFSISYNSNFGNIQFLTNALTCISSKDYPYISTMSYTYQQFTCASHSITECHSH